MSGTVQDTLHQIRSRNARCVIEFVNHGSRQIGTQSIFVLSFQITGASKRIDVEAMLLHVCARHMRRCFGEYGIDMLASGNHGSPFSLGHDGKLTLVFHDTFVRYHANR